MVQTVESQHATTHSIDLLAVLHRIRTGERC